ncbi:hypothetical protein AVEN_55794-1 [Araneus ventricosus]|uniref:Uncharacterized protein n=1 Tax=Araneus ventricosus TaxID=182803 RepID=A0A4Y2EZN8_ARAVE|nr:hypothetical protein AVEN_55794-1 [Araneus ventricosus]
MVAGGRQETTAGISRGHKLSYEIQIVKIGPVVGAGGLSHVFSHRECTMEMHFSISFENGEELQATIDDMSRRHKLAYETKIIEIGPLIGDEGLVLWLC